MVSKFVVDIHNIFLFNIAEASRNLFGGGLNGDLWQSYHVNYPLTPLIFTVHFHSHNMLNFVIRTRNTPNQNAQENQNSPSKLNTTPTHNASNISPGNPIGVVKGIQQSKTPESDSPVLKDVPPYR